MNYRKSLSQQKITLKINSIINNKTTNNKRHRIITITVIVHHAAANDRHYPYPLIRYAIYSNTKSFKKTQQK